MLIIKQINGKTKYAYEPDTVSPETTYTPILLPKLAAPQSHHTLKNWYYMHRNAIEDVIALFEGIIAEPPFDATNTYHVIVNKERFQQLLANTLYQVSDSKRKDYI